MNEKPPLCRHVAMLINRRLDQECLTGESNALDQHLTFCENCRLLYQAARGLEMLLDQLSSNNINVPNVQKERKLTTLQMRRGWIKTDRILKNRSGE